MVGREQRLDMKGPVVEFYQVEARRWGEIWCTRPAQTWRRWRGDGCRLQWSRRRPASTGRVLMLADPSVVGAPDAGLQVVDSSPAPHKPGK